MKRILALILFLALAIPVSLLAYDWDANVIAMYDFEQNGDDDLGTYDLDAIGTPTFTVTQTVTPTVTPTIYAPLITPWGINLGRRPWDDVKDAIKRALDPLFKPWPKKP